MLHWGGGFEWQFYKSLGIAAEVGIVHLLEAPEYPGGMLSVNGSYYFRNARPGEKSLVPFVTAGYTLDPFSTSSFNLGGGVNYWSRGRMGLRLEVRDHVSGQPAGVCLGNNPDCRNWFLEFRVGLNFR